MNEMLKTLRTTTCVEAAQAASIPCLQKAVDGGRRLGFNRTLAERCAR